MQPKGSPIVKLYTELQRKSTDTF